MSQSNDLLMAYADGELDAETARQVELWVARDPAARAQVQMHRDMTSLLRSACGETCYAPATPSVPKPRARLAPTRRQAGVAIAAGLAGGLLGVGLGRMLPAADEPDLLSEVAEYHGVILRETSHLAERPDDPDAAAWLGARIGRRLAAPDLGAAALRFVGVRLLVFDGRPVADLLYTRPHGTPVGLCVVRLPGGGQAIRLARRDGLRLATWRDGTYAYVVVGDLTAADASDIADMAAAQFRERL